jgi:outer membrane protein TolC
MGSGADFFRNALRCRPTPGDHESALAGYDGTVATYRQTVLNAYQQVEDNLVALDVLNTESAQQHSATTSAEKSLQLTQNRYAGGVDTYLQAVVWQTTALTNELYRHDETKARGKCSVFQQALTPFLGVCF